MFRLQFETDNAAFHEEDGNVVVETSAIVETRRILLAVSAALVDGESEGKCVDINGNTVGDWKLEPS